MKTTCTIKAGDTTWTFGGSGRGVDNTAGEKALVFMALIVNK